MAHSIKKKTKIDLRTAEVENLQRVAVRSVHVRAPLLVGGQRGQRRRVRRRVLLHERGARSARAVQSVHHNHRVQVGNERRQNAAQRIAATTVNSERPVGRNKQA